MRMSLSRHSLTSLRVIRAVADLIGVTLPVTTAMTEGIAVVAVAGTVADLAGMIGAAVQRMMVVQGLAATAITVVLTVMPTAHQPRVRMPTSMKCRRL
jgi:hypothetical protein